ncbi:hypothetical protein CMI47_06790 [Candidatus Pacearchaeota archaeon]|nr:hypothetical protein [Candidatus Pacearchaeota archaeon]|tara:strand:- start:152 stop:358 length:207 start_codon:yes stop_codon:yes gene_type:complete
MKNPVSDNTEKAALQQYEVRRSHRVLRGGGWDKSPFNLESASRNSLNPSYRINNLGFRVVRNKPKKKK